MLFTPFELIDMVIMIAAVGYIFKDMFPHQINPDDPVASIMNQGQSQFWSAVYAVAPAVLLHELGHKFSALYFGIDATFHAAYLFLAVGVILKFFNFPFIFFVPAYVSHAGSGPLHNAVIAIMGPLINGVLALFCFLSLKFKFFDHRYSRILQMSMTVNFFLLLLNLLPLPGIDGFQFYASIWQLLS